LPMMCQGEGGEAAGGARTVEERVEQLLCLVVERGREFAAVWSIQRARGADDGQAEAKLHNQRRQRVARAQARNDRRPQVQSVCPSQAWHTSVLCVAIPTLHQDGGTPGM
jgi:hypothetical protein